MMFFLSSTQVFFICWRDSCSFIVFLLSGGTPSGEQGGDPGDIGDDQQHDEGRDQKGNHRFGDLLEVHIGHTAGHIQVHAHRRCEQADGYRKAGYSKKFREEHEEEILLHQAAKNAFDDMEVKKLPKVKELQAEYARLLEEKKKTYAEYRRSRKEMRELLAAKANVDRIIGKATETNNLSLEKDILPVKS